MFLKEFTHFGWKGKRRWEIKRGVWTPITYFYRWCHGCPVTPVKVHQSLNSLLQKSLYKISRCSLSLLSYKHRQLLIEKEGWFKRQREWSHDSRGRAKSHGKQLLWSRTETYSRNSQHGPAGFQNCYGAVTAVCFLLYFPPLPIRGSPMSIPPLHVEHVGDINNLIYRSSEGTTPKEPYLHLDLIRWQDPFKLML